MHVQKYRKTGEHKLAKAAKGKETDSVMNCFITVVTEAEEHFKCNYAVVTQTPLPHTSE